MRTNRLVLIVVLCSMSLCSSQEWTKQFISGVGTIDFPNTIEIFDEQGYLVYNTEDSNAFYTVTIMSVDEDVGAEIEENLDEFYEGNIVGALKQSGGELLEKRSFLVDNHRAYEIKYTATKNPELPDIRYKRIIFVAPFLINIEFWPKFEGKDMAILKSKFFNSLVLDNSIEETISLVPNDTKNDAFDRGYAIGYALGQIMFYALVLLLFVGIPLFFILRAKTKKKAISAKKSITKETVLMEKKICSKCDNENKPEAKYCSKCGFALL